MMLSLKAIRDNPDAIRLGLNRLHADAPLDEILVTDEERRGLLAQVESLKAERNRVSKEIGNVMRQDPAVAEARKAEMRALGDRIEVLDSQLQSADDRLTGLLLAMPNLPHDSVPDGVDDSQNIVRRKWGSEPIFDFAPRPHWEIGESLGILDFERGVKISGTRFYVLKGLGARLQRALITWMLDVHIEQGYQEIYPPYIVKAQCLYGSGQLPLFADNVYRDAEDDLYLIGTAEIPLANLHRDEILAGTSLPVNYVAYSACFRREKMSAGRDVRGIKRGHQFDKVEMFKFVAPERSYVELEALVSHAEEIPKRLGIPYRIIEMCAGDLGFTATKKYDVEMWAPGCNEWLEVSSCSNCGDFQARRANIRFRPTAAGRPEYVHTLNGSGLALPRTMIAVLENYQQADGSVVVPAVLRPYMAGVEVIR
jgi:seryl-tRNA synthetase